MALNEGRANKPIEEGGLHLFYYKDKIKAHKINLIDRSLKTGGLLSPMIWNILKSGYLRKNTHLGKYVEYHLKFFQKNRDLLSNETVHTSQIYERLIQAKKAKVKLTENQLLLEKTLRFKFEKIWEIIENLQCSKKQQFLLWRYFNNLLPIPRKLACKLCGEALRKNHIIFECPVIRNKIKNLKIGNYTLNIKKWNENDIIFRMLRDIYHDNKIINWNTYRTQLGIINKIWWNFTDIQYGDRKIPNMLTDYTESIIKYVNEANITYLLRKKKRTKKTIKETEQVRRNEVKSVIFKSSEYAILACKFRKS